jgi:hypothetical protein
MNRFTPALGHVSAILGDGYYLKRSLPSYGAVHLCTTNFVQVAKFEFENSDF